MKVVVPLRAGRVPPNWDELPTVSPVRPLAVELSDNPVACPPGGVTCSSMVLAVVRWVAIPMPSST